MKLHHFRDFVAIAEHGSVRAAALSLGLAQPALSRSLSELEHALGAVLFERHARGMRLTQAGHGFFQRANVILNEVRRAQEDVQQVQQGGGEVCVGLSIAAHMVFLPKVLRPFRARYPDTKLHLIEGFFPTLEADLRNGKLDFYVGPKPDPLPTSDLVVEDLFENTRAVLCRKGHPLAKARSLEALAAAEWATTSLTQKAEEELRSLFEAHDLPPAKLALRCQSALTLLMAVAHSDLLVVGPIQWADLPLTTGMLDIINVIEGLPAPTITLVRRASTPLTPAATHCLDLFRRTIPRRDKVLKPRTQLNKPMSHLNKT